MAFYRCMNKKEEGFNGLLEDYAIEMDIIEPIIAECPDAKTECYDPWTDWLYLRQYASQGYTLTSGIPGDVFSQTYASTDRIGMLALLRLKIDPSKIKKITYDIDIPETPKYSNAASPSYPRYNWNLYLTDHLKNDVSYYNYSEQVLYRTPLLNTNTVGEYWDFGNNVGSIDISEIGITVPCYLGIGAPGWTFTVNDIDFEEV